MPARIINTDRAIFVGAREQIDKLLSGLGDALILNADTTVFIVTATPLAPEAIQQLTSLLKVT